MYRCVIVNTWAIFGSIAGYFRVKNQQFLDRIGIRAFYGNCIIVFVLYFVALGILPRYLFAKLHNDKHTVQKVDRNSELDDTVTTKV